VQLIKLLCACAVWLHPSPPFRCKQVMHELVDAVMQLDADSSVRAIIITGRGKAFAAGADIREMAGLDQAQVRGSSSSGSSSSSINSISSTVAMTCV
jgi:hypothetical protein